MASHTRRRTGFTLLELMLVMAIIVIMGAIAYPSIDNYFGYFKLSGAADSLKGSWSQARARAIHDGVPYRFSIIPGTNHYRVAPDSPEFWTGDQKTSTDQDNAPLIIQTALPAGIVFNLGNDVQPLDTTKTTSSDSDKDAVDPGAWVTAFVFQPDGTANNDYTITLQAEGTSPITLRLRGLTGTVKTITGKEDR